VNNALQVLLQK